MGSSDGVDSTYLGGFIVSSTREAIVANSDPELIITFWLWWGLFSELRRRGRGRGNPVPLSWGVGTAPKLRASRILYMTISTPML